MRSCVPWQRRRRRNLPIVLVRRLVDLKPNWGQLALELVVIFVGVTAAFIVENIREDRAAMDDLRQAARGIIVELRHYGERGQFHARNMLDPIEEWRQADAAGRRAAPAVYRIPGGPAPPTAAWDGAVSSGVANRLDPEFRRRLGYFYNEYRGIHTNYRRHLEFIEREVLPRTVVGVEAFYPDGAFDPAVRTRLALLEEFAADLQRLSVEAETLADELEVLLDLDES